MNTFYKWKINTLSNLSRNTGAIKMKRQTVKCIKNAKRKVTESAMNGRHEQKLYYCRKEFAEGVVAYFTKHGFKAVYEKVDKWGDNHMVTISW